MGARVHFVVLPLSRALREANGNPDKVWQILGLETWVTSEFMRKVAAWNPTLVENVKGVFRDALTPEGALKLDRIVYLSPYMELGWTLTAEDYRFLEEIGAVDAFARTTPEGRGHSLALLWLVESWESLIGRPIWYAADGHPIEGDWMLHGVELRPDFENATFIPLSFLEETSLDALQEKVLREKVQDPLLTNGIGEEYRHYVENVFAILRDAKARGLDVLALQP